MFDEEPGKLVEVQHGPATVTGDEHRMKNHYPLGGGKVAASRMTRKSGYQTTHP